MGRCSPSTRCTVPAPTAQEDKGRGDEGEESSSYKSSHQYSEHLQEKTEAASQFSKSRSIKEQRQYLPIFAVRQEVSG